MFPGNGQNALAGAVRVEQVELLFYKQPIVAADFSWPADLNIISTKPPAERPEADLGLVAPFSQADQWCLTRGFSSRGRDERSSYILELEKWRMPEPEWERDSIDIQYIHDLPGAQLFFDIGGTGKAADSRQGIEISAIDLRINGKPVAISPKDLHKHIAKNREQEGHPYWEFNFPDDFNAVFRSGTR